MVGLVNDEDANTKADAPITKKTFLTSLRLDYADTGVPCEVESISQVFKNKMNKGQPSLFVNINILDMPKCKARIIGEDGKAKQMLNELADAVDEITEIDATGETVSISFNLKKSKSKDYEYFVHNMSSFYPLLNTGLIANGDIDADNDKSININYDEILDALEGLEFRAYAVRIEPEQKTIAPFDKLLAEVEE